MLKQIFIIAAIIGGLGLMTTAIVPINAQAAPGVGAGNGFAPHFQGTCHQGQHFRNGLIGQQGFDQCIAPSK